MPESNHDVRTVINAVLVLLGAVVNLATILAVSFYLVPHLEAQTRQTVNNHYLVEENNRILKENSRLLQDGHDKTLAAGRALTNFIAEQERLKRGGAKP